jgi:heme/copper-type cytochrome/quinol oxidase subunit 2
MENETFNKEILEKLQELRIKPRARWHFLLKNYAIWISGVVALLVGAASVSVIIYLSSYNDFSIRQDINKSLGEMLLLTLPYFWLLFLGLFIFVVYYNLKHTKTGYRYSVWTITFVAVGGSMFLGCIFFAAGLGKELDEVLGQNAPLYGEMINPRVDFWSNPEEGRLIGVIVSQTDDGNFVLIDKDQHEWTVEIKSDDFVAVPLSGGPLRLIGQKKSDDVFEVFRVLPMMPGHGFFKRLNVAPHPAGPIINDNFMPPDAAQFRGNVRTIERADVNF